MELAETTSSFTGAVVRPRLQVFGAGEYFRRLLPGIRRYFDLTTIFEVRGQGELGFDEPERELVRVFQRSEHLDADAFMILTPPASHCELIEACAGLGKPVFVEKPLVIDVREGHRILALANYNPNLYCSDYFPDVGSTALLTLFGKKTSPFLQSRIQVKSNDAGLWEAGLEGLGEPLRIRGLMLQGVGPAASFTGREWLWDNRRGGGVILDLMYHYICLTRLLFEDEVRPQQCEIKTRLENGNLVDWMADGDRAETYASVKGVVGDGVEVELEVGKYIEGVNRLCYSVEFEHGSADMDYGGGSALRLQSAGKSAVVGLEGNSIDHVSARFREFVAKDLREPHGLTEALSTLQTIERIKALASGT